ncbi:MAG: riboflavin synthase [Leptospiraceae bacterium]|nr:riboflavin synthase [Leptospiraceae bacterium]
MFTGIVETTGIVKKIQLAGTNKIFFIESPISNEFRIGDSVSHNGVCLTIEEIQNSEHRVTTVIETLSKTNFMFIQENSIINLERSLRLQDRLEGHFVMGHVDCMGIVWKKTFRDGSWEFQILYPDVYKNLVIPRGSIAIDGISLTISNLADQTISQKQILERFFMNQSIFLYEDYLSLFVNIIPHTYRITNVSQWKEGSLVNLEFDMLGKYLQRYLDVHNSRSDF